MVFCDSRRPGVRGNKYAKENAMKVNAAFEASKYNLMVLIDSEEVTLGPFTYHKMWFRDAAYTISAILNWILEHATGTWTFPEGIHTETGGGCKRIFPGHNRQPMEKG